MGGAGNENNTPFSYKIGGDASSRFNLGGGASASN